jgi:hypothetical protein|tara:strand:- start:588 stop:911 length:324 start_codon:yes stop_codon:yes gene_type:complete
MFFMWPLEGCSAPVVLGLQERKKPEKSKGFFGQLADAVGDLLDDEDEKPKMKTRSRSRTSKASELVRKLHRNQNQRPRRLTQVRFLMKSFTPMFFSTTATTTEPRIT